MTILHISDTHNQHRSLTDLPYADVIVHSGDFCFAGTEDEAFDFINWFCDLPYKHKIFIAGNHDECLLNADSIEGLDENCHYLNNSSVVIDGVKFYGIPFFLEDVVDSKFEKLTERIPFDSQVLITHTPPFGILDYSDGIHYGSNHLLEQIQQRKSIWTHLFGHIHDAIGVLQQDSIRFCNSSVLDENYNLHNQKYTIVEMPLDCLNNIL